MIYIKDYGSINRQLAENRRDGFAEALASLKGGVVTVFTRSGGVSGRGFTGMILEIRAGCLTLLLDACGPPDSGFSRSKSKSKKRSRFGTKAVIPVSQICAVAAHYA